VVAPQLLVVVLDVQIQIGLRRASFFANVALETSHVVVDDQLVTVQVSTLLNGFNTLKGHLHVRFYDGLKLRVFVEDRKTEYLNCENLKKCWIKKVQFP
jgi:hypothetical protein